MGHYDPTSSFALNRKKARRRMDHIRLRIRSQLRETVDGGLAMLWDLTGCSYDTLIAEAILIAVRDALEIGDAVDELLRAGAVGPARSLCRTLLELTAIIRYLADRNDERVAATKTIAALREVERSMGVVAGHLGWRPEDVSKELLRIRKARINDEHASWAQLQAAKSLDELRKGQPWYAALDGPTGPRQLLDWTGLGAAYEKFYMPWNWTVHGINFDALDTSERGRLRYRPLRYYEEETADHIDFWAVRFLDLGLVSAAAYISKGRFGTAKTEREAAVLSMIEAYPGDVSIPWQSEIEEG